ncbi:MAG: peptide chain release factor N(5)-glutamine methyltransferase [Bradymonadales bacterium]|nr:MAG: peptide chain release factor N(5)-glutamine methyltransferase [Bradymonadales bacterium]
MAQDSKTILAHLQEGANSLKDKGVENPHREARLLMALALDISVEDLVLKTDANLSFDTEKVWRELLSRRLNREPFSHLRQEKEFFGLRFRVNSSVLTPRPETEALIEIALDWVKEKGLKSGELIDLGTGSGCIVLSLAKRLGEAWAYHALDISSEALKLAQINADRLGLKKVNWIHSDLRAYEPKSSFDLIVSNPPYLSEDFLETLEPEIKNYEPRISLCSGDHGDEILKSILNRWSGALKTPGLMILETKDEAQRSRLLSFASGLGVNGLRQQDCFLLWECR